VPNNVLFEGRAGETIRRKLLRECDVRTLLRLTTGLFYPQGVKANVLFFDKKPASETPWTKKLWIYDLRTNRHFTLKTDPLKREDLEDFLRRQSSVGRRQAWRRLVRGARLLAAARMRRCRPSERTRVRSCFGREAVSTEVGEAKSAGVVLICRPSSSRLRAWASRVAKATGRRSRAPHNRST